MEVKGGGVLVYVADGNCQGRVTSSEFFLGGARKSIEIIWRLCAFRALESAANGFVSLYFILSFFWFGE